MNEIVMNAHRHQKKRTLIYATQNLNHNIGSTHTRSFKNGRCIDPDPRTENNWFCREVTDHLSEPFSNCLCYCIYCSSI